MDDETTDTTKRRGTATSRFGVGKRESHDASEFYARFTPPELSDDSVVQPFPELDSPFILGDARDMSVLPDSSVALVVTSPPYFVGKEYEADILRGEIPRSYTEYLRMLEDVFAECQRVLEPGGRIAVNVANLGRKPYRSLSADVTRILEERLGMLLRGEVIWMKGRGATGSCAWGTFRSPANPVLRDLTERVVIASKGRFDRAQPVKVRAAEGLPHESTVTNDEFLEATLDVWEIPAESARRVGHPAPFPVELPERLIHLYTYRDDVVLDPFMGSGSTMVAAARTDRRYVGFDLDPAYVEISRERVAKVSAPPPPPARPRRATTTPARPAPAPAPDHDDFQARASREGKAAQAIAEDVLRAAGFDVQQKNLRVASLGLTINFVAHDQAGRPWNFDVSGAFTTTRGGLLRTDTVWKALGRAHVLALNDYVPYNVPDRKPNDVKGPYVLLTSHLPARGSDGDKALRRAGTAAFFDALEMFDDDGQRRLAAYATGEVDDPLPGFWSEADLGA